MTTETNCNPALPFYRNALRQPDRPALWVNNELFSYARLAGQARRIASWLLEGSAPLHRVAIFSGRSRAVYEGILGTSWAGACYVPLNPVFPEKRLLNILSRSRPQAMIVDRETLPLLTPAIMSLIPEARILLANGEATRMHGIAVCGQDDLPAEPEMTEPVYAGPDSGAYLVFTSGTTGEPSGVVISNASLAFAVETMQREYGFTPEDRFSQFFDLSFDFSVMDLFVPWLAGASTYSIPAAAKMGPGRHIIDHELTAWTCVPSMITFMDKMRMLSPGIFPSIRFSCFSGETLTAEAARIWKEACPNTRLVNLYGQTEAPIGSLVQTCEQDTPQTEETGGMPLGNILPGVYVDIVDEQGRFAGPGTVGELALAGPHLATGYLDDPERSARKFRTLDHPVHGRRLWYVTGDLGRKTADNIFHFLGRVDNELKIGGHRFMLEEIEFHLRQVSGCAMVAVVPVRTELGVEGLTGYLAGDPPAEKIMKEELLKLLPRPLVPRRIQTIGDMPLSQNGKVDRKALAQRMEK